MFAHTTCLNAGTFHSFIRQLKFKNTLKRREGSTFDILGSYQHLAHISPWLWRMPYTPAHAGPVTPLNLPEEPMQLGFPPSSIRDLSRISTWSADYWIGGINPGPSGEAGLEDMGR